MSEERTPGWAVGAADSCLGYTAEQHLAVAESLLDGQCIKSMSEDAWNGEPPYRMYVTVDDDPDTPVDYTPILAALTHAVLGLAKTRDTSPEQG